MAWEENETGKRILEGVRDIIGVIAANIRHAADVTAEWAKDIDFSPFLTKLQGWIESLRPVFDTLSGTVTDFYEKVLLPLGKWTIEKGLPQLLQALTDFNNKVDWESIRKRLAEFWEHLEPFAEAIGEGLIIFIGKLSDALADFINSPAFEKFLTAIEHWMDTVDADDVAGGLEKICKAILGFKALSAAFSVISFGAGVISKLTGVLGAFGSAGASAAGATASIGSLGAVAATALDNITYLGVGVQEFQQISRNHSMGDVMDSMQAGFVALDDALKNGLITIEQYDAAVKMLGESAEQASLDIMYGGNKGIDAFNAALEEVNTMIQSTSKNMGTLGDEVSTVGYDVAAGFIEGMESYDTQTPIDTIFKGMIASIKSIFGIHSPSTVMAEIGRYIIQGLLNGLKDMWSDVASWIDDKVQWVKDTFSSIIDSVSGFFSGGVFSGGFGKSAGTFSLFSESSPYAANPAFETLNSVPIPRLATGAVIPANREFLAVLGDQKHGTNIEAPLDTIRQANEEAFLKVISKLGLTGGNQRSSGNETFVFQVDGRTFFEITRKYAEEYFNCTGCSPYPI